MEEVIFLILGVGDCHFPSVDSETEDVVDITKVSFEF